MSTGKLAGAGAFTAIAASLCCIAPVLALLAGTGSIASSFSWIEPARPYMIGLTIAILGFAWYQKFNPLPADDCGCVVDKKPSFLQSKTFLLLVSIFAILMIAFPAYSKVFFPAPQKVQPVVAQSSVKTVELNITGMSCEACEGDVSHEVNKLPGIIQSAVSWQKNSARFQFDTSKTTIQKIVAAVNETGYTVTHITIKN